MDLNPVRLCPYERLGRRLPEERPWDVGPFDIKIPTDLRSGRGPDFQVGPSPCILTWEKVEKQTLACFAKVIGAVYKSPLPPTPAPLGAMQPSFGPVNECLSNGAPDEAKAHGDSLTWRGPVDLGTAQHLAGTTCPACSLLSWRV